MTNVEIFYIAGCIRDRALKLSASMHIKSNKGGIPMYSPI